jgi:hypothetical protein
VLQQYAGIEAMRLSETGADEAADRLMWKSAAELLGRKADVSYRSVVFLTTGPAIILGTSDWS